MTTCNGVIIIRPKAAINFLKEGVFLSYSLTSITFLSMLAILYMNPVIALLANGSFVELFLKQIMEQ